MEKSLEMCPVVSLDIHSLTLYLCLAWFALFLLVPLRHKPGGANRPLQHHIPPEHLWQQPHHRGAGEEPTDAHRHQPLPAVAGRQRPDALSLLHAIHPHPQPHEGLRLRKRHLQGGHVLYG